MAGVGFGGFFNGDPDPNPFAEILPPGGALLGDNGQVIVDDPAIDHASFADDEGYDPPTGNGLSTPSIPVVNSFPVGNITNEIRRAGRSKLESLRAVEEDVRKLLYERKRLLSELKTERDEIDRRLGVSDKVSQTLDEMFPDILEREIESGVIDER